MPRALLTGTDLAVGAAARATHLAGLLGGAGWGAASTAGRVVSTLPGAGLAGRLLQRVAAPVVEDGRDVRDRAGTAAQAAGQRLLDTFLPSVVDALDIDSLVRRIDIDHLVRRIEIDALVRRIEIDDLVRRIDIDALVGRIDIDQLVRRIEIDALVQRIDIDGVVSRIDIDAVVERIDVNEVVQRVDVDAVVEETELGTIVARSTSGFASEALDAARSQTAGVDTRLSRAINRALRRKESDVPAGPPLLIGETDATDVALSPATEPASPEPPDQESA
jgi:hypothetical protein